jgi:hypothetical protein
MGIHGGAHLKAAGKASGLGGGALISSAAARISSAR